jgi:hypothetical protein
MDLNKNVKSVVSIKPEVLVASADGAVIDSLDFNSAKLVIAVGALDLTNTDETYNVKVQSCDTAAGVFADITGATVAITAANSLKVIPLNNLENGVGRYLKTVLTIAGTTPSIAISAVLELGDSFHNPIA